MMSVKYERTSTTSIPPNTKYLLFSQFFRRDRTFLHYFKMNVALLLALATSCTAFSNTRESSCTSVTSCGMKPSFDRRDVFATSLSSAAAFLVLPQQSLAAGAPPSKEELDRLKKGYDGIVYLLENFEQETTVCKTDGGRECKRDAEPVRRYMGLRSTTDPLFQIEKVFAKAKYMDLDPDKLEDFFQATEDWNTAMNMSNSMAFISQFG